MTGSCSDEYKDVMQKLNPKEIEKYVKFVELMKKVNFWDFSIYDEVPTSDWVAIDRSDYEKILEIMMEFEQAQPWKQQIERRID